MNNFEKRLYTYLGFLDKRTGFEHLEIIIRELGKVFQLGMDDFYSEEQRKTVIEKLIEYGNMRNCKEEKACYFLFAFKLNKINEFEINVPAIFLDKTLIADKVYEKTPESILNIMSERHREQALEAEKETQPDKCISRPPNRTCTDFEPHAVGVITAPCRKKTAPECEPA